MAGPLRENDRCINRVSVLTEVSSVLFIHENFECTRRVVFDEETAAVSVVPYRLIH